jgi:hypothetical protein
VICGASDVMSDVIGAMIGALQKYSCKLLPSIFR